MTEEQTKFFEAKRKELEANFLEPDYKKYRISYVKVPEEADIQISKHRDVTDYIAIGFACLKKSIEVPAETEIKVYRNENYMSLKMARILGKYSNQDSGRPLYTNALSGVAFDIDNILKHYFQDKRICVMMMGIILYANVTAHLMGYNKVSDIEECLKFRRIGFKNTIKAQQKAFELAKEQLISSVLGSMWAYMFD